MSGGPPKPPREEGRGLFPAADDAGRRGERGLEPLAVPRPDDSGIGHDHGAAIGGRADETPHALAEAENRLGEHEVAEGIAPLFHDPLGAGGHDGIGGHREGEARDHEHFQRLARKIHALPERRGPQENGPGSRAELARERARRFSRRLREERDAGQVERGPDALRDFLQHLVGGQENQRVPAKGGRERRHQGRNRVREAGVVRVGSVQGEGRHLPREVEGGLEADDLGLLRLEPQPSVRRAHRRRRQERPLGERVERVAQDAPGIQRTPVQAGASPLVAVDIRGHVPVLQAEDGPKRLLHLHPSREPSADLLERVLRCGARPEGAATLRSSRIRGVAQRADQPGDRLEQAIDRLGAHPPEIEAARPERLGGALRENGFQIARHIRCAREHGAERPVRLGEG